MAANIQAAIRECVVDIAANNTRAAWDSWVLVFGDFIGASVTEKWDRTKPDQRTVTDWLIPSLQLQGQLRTSGTFNNVETNAVIEIVDRILRAVQAAENAGRITSDQEDAVVDQYNVAFP